jgi:hypothetical protein
MEEGAAGTEAAGTEAAVTEAAEAGVAEAGAEASADGCPGVNILEVAKSTTAEAHLQVLQILGRIVK